MSTAIKGNATEAAVLKAFAERGLSVLVPFGDGAPFDLAVHLGGGDFLRVQCKTGRSLNGCVVFNGRSTDHGRGRLSYAGLADVFGVYFPLDDKVYVVPVASGFAPRLRLAPPRNNQRRGVRFAVDYELGNWNDEALRALVMRRRVEEERTLSIA
ncbi:MAG TPA: group I intron-associated PD-(D/E)XK endonuclease [Solirubrobacterales bacterium]